MEATSDCCIPYRDCALRFEENRRYAAPPPVPVSDSTPDPPEVPEIRTWNRASMVFQPACRINIAPVHIILNEIFRIAGSISNPLLRFVATNQTTQKI